MGWLINYSAIQTNEWVLCLMLSKAQAFNMLHAFKAKLTTLGLYLHPKKERNKKNPTKNSLIKF